MPKRIFFDNDSDLSMKVDHIFDGENIKSNLHEVLRHSTTDFHHIGITSYSDALHIILGLFQDQPLSLKFLGMKKVCELDLKVKELPEELQINAEKETF